jgi:hypothetical protein
MSRYFTNLPLLPDLTKERGRPRPHWPMRSERDEALALALFRSSDRWAGRPPSLKLRRPMPAPRAISQGPKARNSLAQGNALGIRYVRITSPERATQRHREVMA